MKSAAWVNFVSVPTPLAGAKQFLADHGDTGEGQALRKVLRALVTQEGDFSEAEVYLFSAETPGLVDALVDLRFKGVYSAEEWRSAI